MDERSDVEKIDEVILPGFRFHPTDEELVGFYLKRKVQQKPLSIELIRQLNIYKYDPWDLPKLATTGEKEWYFYCPRDRKYRNSARPNRVTGAGFWKATGTDRPIYSSEGTKCIGLKKSLVFYKGRAAKGMKTDWMMHEFRLPSVTDTSLPKRPIDKNIPINDSWAICRIFKKTNSMTQRAISQSWVSPLPETTTDSDIFSVSCTTDAGSTIQYSSNSTMQQQHQTAPPANYPTLDHNNKPTNLAINSFKTSPLVIPSTEIPTGFMCSTGEALKPSTADVAAMLLNLPPTIFEDVNRNSTSIDFGQQQQLQQCCNSFTIDLPHETNGDLSVVGREIMCMRKNMGATSSRQPNNVRVATSASSTFPYIMCPNVSDAWRSSATTPWDSPSCPSEVSATYSSKFAALD